MAETEASLRAGIVATCRSMAEQGLNQGTAGNVSARFGDGLLITPSGLPYEEMTPDDIVPMTMDGRAEHALGALLRVALPPRHPAGPPRRLGHRPRPPDLLHRLRDVPQEHPRRPIT